MRELMRYRDLPDWTPTLEAARYLWRWVPNETWDKLGNLEAPAHVTHLRTANELLVAAADAKLVTFPIGR
jgi:hypothetical protein